MNITNDMIMSGISRYIAIEQLARFATDVTDAEDARWSLDQINDKIDSGQYTTTMDFLADVTEAYYKCILKDNYSPTKPKDNTSIRYEMLI